MSEHLSCRSERPPRRHHMVWSLVGEYVVTCCAHCHKVEKSHPIGEGDAYRVAASQDAHALFCDRPSAWTWLREDAA